MSFSLSQFLRDVRARYQLSRCDVIGDRITCHVLQRLLTRNTPRWPAYDRGELELPVRLFDVIGHHDGIMGTDDTGPQAHEDEGLPAGSAFAHHFSGVGAHLLLVGGRVACNSSIHDEIDDVLVVIRTRLKDLAWPDRRMNT